MSMKATYISRLSERGQVSVPIAIRNALGLTPSSRIAWTLDAENGNTGCFEPLHCKRAQKHFSSCELCYFFQIFSRTKV